MTDLVLASASAARRQLLENAGVSFSVEAAGIDEAAIKESLAAEQATGSRVAEVLAELKAMRVSIRHPGKFVLGCDQVLDLNGRLFDKPADLAEAADHLRALSGKRHSLATAAVIAQNGAAIWRDIAVPQLTMRSLSPEFIDDYLTQVGEAATSSVGAYQLEGLGAQLFERVDGDFFSILGLPLLSVLGFLRVNGVIAN